jgi:RHS repeat-associated protein
MALTRNWTYDVAGNRTSDSGNSGTWTYDNLNRMSASPGLTYYNDVVGNRTSRNYQPGAGTQPNSNARLYQWDVLNRMTATAGTSSGYRNVYRADGMRMQKIDDISLNWVENPNQEDGSGFYDPIYSTNKPTTRYFYDGQMCVEDEYTVTTNNVTTITSSRYGLGARGIDYIAKHSGVNGVFDGCQFPIYDTHGNMVLTISRAPNSTSQNPSYESKNRRSFDVWGSVRTSENLGSPTNKQRYCANLGHVEDDESGLIYMRARYNEPWTGRFLSEDPAMDGANWYIYCKNEPICNGDVSGRLTVATALLVVLLYYAFASQWWDANSPEEKCAKMIIEYTLIALAALDVLREVMKTDSRTRLTGSEVATAMAVSTMGLVLIAIAGYQLGIMLFLATEGDYDIEGAGTLRDNQGNIRSIFGRHRW